jgi:hypothetical protein
MAQVALAKRSIRCRLSRDPSNARKQRTNKTMSEEANTPTTESANTATETTQTTTAPSTEATSTQAGFAAFLDESGSKFREGWTAGLPDHLKQFEKTLAKFPSPTDLLGSYANLEKKLSSKTPTAPSADATDEQRAEWRKLIGTPATPEDYGLAPGEGMEATWNAELAKSAASVAHKYGISQAALGELVELYNSTMRGAAESAETEAAGEAERVMATLQKEWGKDAGANAGRVQRAATSLGLDLSDPKYGNDANIAKALLRHDLQFNEDAGLIGEGEAAGYKSRMEQIDTKLRSLPASSDEAQNLVAEKRRLWEALQR